MRYVVKLLCLLFVSGLRAQVPVNDTIPFALTEFNNIRIQAVVDKRDTLWLKFDSGATGLLLTNDVIKKTHLTYPDSPIHSLQIGNLKWDSLEIYPVVLSGQGTEGRFGWDLFAGKIIEIDYDRNNFIVHTQLPAISKTYSKLKIAYEEGLFCIVGSLRIKDKIYPGRFLFDNGYQRTIMLDTALMREQHYPKDLDVIKKVAMKNGQGKDVPVITVNNERLDLGSQSLYNIPVQLMTGANPAGLKVHILGNEVLKRFNTIIDLQHGYVFLKPNSLFGLPYADAK